MLWRLGLVFVWKHHAEYFGQPVHFDDPVDGNWYAANMAVEQLAGIVVLVTAYDRIWGRVVSKMSSSGQALEILTFRMPWDLFECAACLDLGWGQRRRGSWNREGVDRCATGEDEEKCPPHDGEV